MKTVEIQTKRDFLRAEISIAPFPSVHTPSVWVGRGACQEATIEIGELIMSRERAKELRDQMDAAITIAEKFDQVPCPREHLFAFLPDSSANYRCRAVDGKLVAEKLDGLSSPEVAELVAQLRDLATKATT